MTLQTMNSVVMHTHYRTIYSRGRKRKEKVEACNGECNRAYFDKRSCQNTTLDVCFPQWHRTQLHLQQVTNFTSKASLCHFYHNTHRYNSCTCSSIMSWISLDKLCIKFGVTINMLIGNFVFPKSYLYMWPLPWQIWVAWIQYAHFWHVL